MSKKPLLKRFLCIALPIFVLMLIFDLLSKHFFDSSMQIGQTASFLPGFIDIVIVHNEGSAWGMLAGMDALIIILTLIFLAAIAWYTISDKITHPIYHVALGLLLAGSVGNLVDRISFGYVRDFLHFEFWPSFPVFNVADICLTVGVLLFVIYAIMSLVKHYKKEKNEKSDANTK